MTCSGSRLLSQTTLRNILGTKNLHEILSDREGISGAMQVGQTRAGGAKDAKGVAVISTICSKCIVDNYIEHVTFNFVFSNVSPPTLAPLNNRDHIILFSLLFNGGVSISIYPFRPNPPHLTSRDERHM